MKTTPMLLRPDMALAWADGRKIRTQRVIKPQPGAAIEKIRFDDDYGSWIDEAFDFVKKRKCPYGGPGDRLNLLTTWSTLPEYDEIKPSELYKVLPHGANLKEIWVYFDSAEKPEGFGKLRPGRFMPKWMRELMPKPKILSLGVRRIQEITDAECLDEGIEYVPREIGFDCYRWSLGEHYEPTPRDAFRKLWNSINGEKHPWDANPWVFNIEMEGPE